MISMERKRTRYKWIQRRSRFMPRFDDSLSNQRDLGTRCCSCPGCSPGKLEPHHKLVNIKAVMAAEILEVA